MYTHVSVTKCVVTSDCAKFACSLFRLDLRCLVKCQRTRILCLVFHCSIVLTFYVRNLGYIEGLSLSARSILVYHTLPVHCGLLV